MGMVEWFVIRLLINAGGLIFVSRIIEGIVVESFSTALTAALILGVLNAFIRPILALLTLPINILTLGLFSFILNAGLLLVVASVVPGFEIAGFGSALMAALILWAISVISNVFFHGGKT